MLNPMEFQNEDEVICKTWVDGNPDQDRSGIIVGKSRDGRFWKVRWTQWGRIGRKPSHGMTTHNVHKSKCRPLNSGAKQLDSTARAL